jgi:NDP-sugar pyrophosphorylase family protein
MKALILAGGEGTRLRPLTYAIPKALIPVQGRTLTDQVLDIYKKIGVNDIVLSVSYLADQIIDYFGDGKKLGINIEYLREEKPRGTAGPLLILRERNRQIKEDFFMSNGDNLFNLDLLAMLDFHKKNNGVATIGLSQIEDTSQFGVAKLEGDKIIEFVEKPQKELAPSNYINSGYYILSPQIFNYLPQKDFVMLEKDVWPVLAKAGELFGFKSSAQWFDTGTPQRHAQVEAEWRK